MIELRQAQAGDLHKLLPIVERYFLEDRVDALLTPEEVAGMTANMLANPHCSVFYVDVDGEVAGVAGTSTVTSMGKLTTQEVVWRVEKPYTKTKAGSLLFQALEEDAEARGAKAITVVAAVDGNEKRLGHSYVAKGYEPLAHTYIKNLE